jgi:hypothetical protein
MHVEKNVFAKILNMVMALYCNHHNMKLLNDELDVVRAKTIFALYNNAQFILSINGFKVFNFLRDICFKHS